MKGILARLLKKKKYIILLALCLLILTSEALFQSSDWAIELLNKVLQGGL